MDTSIIHLPL